MRSTRNRVATTIAGFLFLASPLLANGSCLDNFTQDKNFYKTFVEIEGVDPDAAFVAMAQNMAPLLGLTVNKDLGIISAYQEMSGKRSHHTAVVAKTHGGGVRIETTFLLAEGQLAPTAAIRDVLCERLDSALPPEQRALPGAKEAAIRLVTSSGELPLSSTVGKFRKSGISPFQLYFFDFPNDRADVRAQSSQLEFLIRTATDPSRSYVLVKCDSDRDANTRSVKSGSAGSLARAGLTGRDNVGPDADWTIPISAEKRGDDLWLIRPLKSLEPGEYGLWELASNGVALFGVD